MDSAGWTAGERPAVGVLDAAGADGDERSGSPARIDAAISAVVTEYDGTVVSEPPNRLEEVLAADPGFLVAVGERPFAALVRADVDIPVLPVDVDPAIDATSADGLSAAIETVLDGEALERRRPLLSVTSGAAFSDLALFDVTLATAEPAHISEYAISCRGEEVAQFRADGVVVATPVGTRGYAGTVSAPELSPAVDAVAVSPIAPFVTHANRWVLPDDDLSLSIERDEATISVSADGRTIATGGPETRVDLAVESSLSTLGIPDDVQ